MRSNTIPTTGHDEERGSNGLEKATALSGGTLPEKVAKMVSSGPSSEKVAETDSLNAFIAEMEFSAASRRRRGPMAYKEDLEKFKKELFTRERYHKQFVDKSESDYLIDAETAFIHRNKRMSDAAFDLAKIEEAKEAAKRRAYFEVKISPGMKKAKELFISMQVGNEKIELLWESRIFRDWISAVKSSRVSDLYEAIFYVLVDYYGKGGVVRSFLEERIKIDKTGVLGKTVRGLSKVAGIKR